MTLDFVAKRYGKLPSEVLKTGDTADVQCAELAIRYEAYLNKQANDKADGKVTHNHSQEDLLNMIKRVKDKNENTPEDK